MKMKIYLPLLASALLFTAYDAAADEVCRACPFSCDSIGVSRKDCSNRGYRDGRCCVDLDERGLDQLRDRERGHRGERYSRGSYNFPYNRGRYDRDYDRGRYDGDDYRQLDRYGNYVGPDDDYRGRGYGRGRNRRPKSETVPDYGRYGPRGDCPPGYHVNDRKCTDAERREGCMDQRSPSNQICVGWRR